MKCCPDGKRTFDNRSPPSRGAWIEIPSTEKPILFMRVAPLAGGVD